MFFWPKSKISSDWHIYLVTNYKTISQYGFYIRLQAYKITLNCLDLVLKQDAPNNGLDI